ncbi:putative amino-acid permease PB24D3.02c [Exophiala dermatitidis]
MSAMDKSADYAVDFRDDQEDDVVVDDRIGTLADRKAMARLGKEQVFKRNFSFVSIFGFALIIMNTWETILTTVAFGLGNGGPGGLIWTFVAGWIGFLLVGVSMGEMASMAPTSGGQYHWVSEFAPPNVQKVLSYFIGWLGILGYQTGTTIGAYVSGTLIQGLIILNNPNSYVPERWHGTLIAMLITICVAFFNIFLAKHLPLVEGMILVLHIAGFVAIMVPLWVMAPRTSSSEVWTSFTDLNDWGSVGLACLIGLITSAGSLVGGDAAAHMAEELKNSSKMLPRAMIGTIIVNGALGFVMLVTFLYTLGDLDEDIASATGYPIIQVFYTATGSAGGATGLTIIIIILNICSNLTTMAGSSRQMFSFARDKGVPYHHLIARVPPGYDVPVNALIVSVVWACVFHCIYIGSAVAFNIIMSIGTVALLTSYMVSIGTITWKRIRGHPLLPSKFSLGKFGLPINIASLLFCFIVYIFVFFPSMPNPELVAMNWAIAVYGGVLVLAAIYFVLQARHHYVGPVAYVRKTI